MHLIRFSSYNLKFISSGLIFFKFYFPKGTLPWRWEVGKFYSYSVSYQSNQKKFSTSAKSLFSKKPFCRPENLQPGKWTR